MGPSVKMPFAFDDMLHNNLGGVAPASLWQAGDHVVSGNFRPECQTCVLGYLLNNLRWANVSELSKVSAAAPGVEDGAIESHYLFQSFVKDAKIRYAVVNLVREEEEFKVVISQEERRAFGVMTSEIFHEARTSFLGLPWKNRRVLTDTCAKFEEDFHAFNRKKLLRALQKSRGSQLGEKIAQELSEEEEEEEEKEEEYSYLKAIENATIAIKSIASTWQEVVGAFKTVKKEELKERVSGEGFSYYKSKSRFLRTIGIPFKKYGGYLKDFKKLMGFKQNAKYAEELNTAIRFRSLFDENEWKADQFTFGIDSGGSTNSAVVIGRKSDQFKKCHIIAVLAKGTFKLQPDTYIWTKYKSVMGGITENTKDVRKFVPKALTEAQVKALNALILLNSIKMMSENFGITLKFPDEIPWKK